MNKHIKYQTISHQGKPIFAVIPYKEFVELIPNVTIKQEQKSNKGIPHEVVHKMVHDNISLLCSWRQYLGFTQKEIAEKLSISQAALSQIEDVDSKPRKKTLQKISDIFNVPIEYLY